MERLDDQDPRIRYTPASAWFTGGVPVEYNSTTHGSRSSPAEMFFQFNGTSVTVYGTITPHLDLPSPVDEFILDGSPPKQFAPTVDGVAHRRQILFSSASLEDRFHTLVMRRTVDGSESWIDYIDFTPSVMAAGGEHPIFSLSSSLSSAPSPSSHLPTPSSTVNQPQNKCTNGVQPKSLSTSALIGIVVACVILFLAVLVLLLLFFRRRRWNARARSGSWDISPFVATTQKVPTSKQLLQDMPDTPTVHPRGPPPYRKL